MIVKTGLQAHLTEAATMRFVAENTSIPVPKIYCSFVHKGRAFTLMERIQGEPIATALRKLSDLDQWKVYAQLRAMIQELRAINPPSNTGVQSCTGGSLHDSRITHGLPRFGPFKTIQAFHFWLRREMSVPDIQTYSKESRHECDWTAVEKMATMQDGQWPPSVFTHADLNPCNILVHGNKVVSIIDWEFSGWYPDYWEYTSSWYGAIVHTQWQDEILKFFEPFPKELSMEITRQKYWGSI